MNIGQVIRVLKVEPIMNPVAPSRPLEPVAPAQPRPTTVTDARR
jgi:hypothetical protein